MTGPTGAHDDAALVSAILAGDSGAFTELMRRHKDTIYRFIRRYVGDADESYDLLQETFVAAWSALSSFDPSKPMAAWLRRIALNKCRDWSRRRQVRRFFFGAKSIEDSAYGIAAPEQGDNSGREQELATLDVQIAALPTPLKEALILTQLEGLSHKEAARLLAISPKAVEMRVYRARQILGEQLKISNDETG